MTTLFDITADHTGQASPDWPNAGWVDWVYTMVAGAIPQSFYLANQTGNANDVQLGFCEGAGCNPSEWFFVAHTTGPNSGVTLPANYRTTPNTMLKIYTRTPDVGGPILWRAVVSDQPTTSAPDPSFCPYGTRLQTDVGGNVILTTGTIDAIASRLGPLATVLAAVFSSFVGRVLYVGALCSGPPPVMPTFTADDWIGGSPGLPMPGSLGNFWQGMQAAAWPYFCECSPAPAGQPAPITYPDPVVTTSGPVPTPLASFTCDNMDLCGMLNAMWRDINNALGQLSLIRRDVTLIQRQGVPFAYVQGATHTGLMGQGELAVQGILGLIVQYTDVPSRIATNAYDPETYYGIGRITLGTADGWRQSHYAQHNPWQLLPIDGDVTRVAYTFADGAVANIVELVREP